MNAESLFPQKEMTKEIFSIIPCFYNLSLRFVQTQKKRPEAVGKADVAR
ncbi:hypothetical protein KZZ20_07955 [Methylacidiphilum fumariolicum]|nr:hypothetical protein [Candidatus Methylacidiphilum fumarolicum]MBW6415442.1 hypothetical protein [Candidatus Methylacidiphilum fumarolicum]